MKIAAVTMSFQGPPEEPIAGRVAHFLAIELQEAYPNHEVKLFDRSMYLGLGDAFSKLARDIDAWSGGGGIAIHIHADAWKPGSFGFTTIYGLENGHALANYIYISMAEILVPQKYTKGNGIIRQPKDTVLNKKTPATIVEVGFYTNPRELDNLEHDWYCAIVAHAIAIGAEKYIARHLGIDPGEEAEMAARTSSDPKLEHHYPDVWFRKYRTEWLHMQNRGDETAAIRVSACLRPVDGGSYHTVKELTLPPDGMPNTYEAFDLRDLLVKQFPALKEESLNISVHATQPITCILREE